MIDLLDEPPRRGRAAGAAALDARAGVDTADRPPSDAGGAPDAGGAGPGDAEIASLDVATVRERTSTVSRVVTLVAVVVPAGALLSAAGVLWGVAFRPLDLVLFLVLYVLTGLGITVGYHRFFTHRSFDAGPVVKVALAILGAMTLQGPVTQWVTDHRKHHARSDRDGDPHSPHLSGDGLVGTARGLWHAHVGWMFTTKGMERGAAYGRDLVEDPTIQLIDRLYLVWVALSVGLPFLVGFAVTGSVARGVEALVWAGLVRIFAFEHATFAVNSICHTFGRRTFEARDQSRNNWFVAILTFGEGWHNNHHAFPRSARHGLHARQLDVSWIVIRTLERLGLARNLRVPTPAQVVRAVRVDAAAG
ncbi:MAG TPA: fatty acid desaturase [Acidimicrobiales bacterium]|nr:fatty acid desaturase [Acidimicrobiales bacterium]